ncbi:hypothetical protein [Corynebacterium sp. H130]|uniref:hypothetical protein n=1 Tax=Corynebacterium sp. H130 TaxID=3133444 RepID=UPI0030AC003C
MKNVGTCLMCGREEMFLTALLPHMVPRGLVRPGPYPEPDGAVCRVYFDVVGGHAKEVA